MLRITLGVNNDGSMVRLAGRLADEFVGEAERVCLSAEAPLLIDATGLQEADADGIALLAKILAGGGRIEGLSRYLAMRVEALRERAGTEVRTVESYPGLRVKGSGAQTFHDEALSGLHPARRTTQITYEPLFERSPAFLKLERHPGLRHRRDGHH
jgi:hypothetical protein